MKIWHVLAITILAAVALYGETVQKKSIETSAQVAPEFEMFVTTVTVEGKKYLIIEDGYITTENGRLVHYQVLDPIIK